MPILAIPAALIAGAIAATDIAAAGLTIGTALELTAAVGATLGAVGVVTRDKGLQTAGLIIGGIGGIGALASSAGLLGDTTASLFGDATTAASDIPASVAVTPEVAGVGAGGADLAAVAPYTVQTSDLPAGAASTNVVDALQPGAGGNPELAAANAPTPAAAAATAPVTGTDTADLGTTNAQTPLMSQASAAVNATPPSSVQVPQAAQAAGASIPGMINVTPEVPGLGAPSQLSDALNGVNQFAHDNPLVTYGLLQAAGGLASGFSPLSAAQTAQYNAQAANNRAAAALTQQQTANIASGQPVATRIPQQVRASVTGAPIGGGLINQTPGAAVTGVPA